MSLGNVRKDLQAAGKRVEAQVVDDNTNDLLTNILKELKKINIHLSIMTDNEIQNSELD